MNKFFYMQDDQMYYVTPILFETDAPMSPAEMSKVSWEPVAAGRLSTGFNTFKKLMEDRGYAVNKIKEYERNTKPTGFPYVIGATGNY
jgi:hypothetical protein